MARFGPEGGVAQLVTRPNVPFGTGGERVIVNPITMFTVYVLRDSEEKLYKGVTNDLPRRLSEHKQGKTITTSKMQNLMVVYTEEFDNFPTARKREIYLKTAAGRRYLHRTLEV